MSLNFVQPDAANGFRFYRVVRTQFEDARCRVAG